MKTYGVWVTNTLNGDQEQRELFLAFGSAYLGWEMPLLFFFFFLFFKTFYLNWQNIGTIVNRSSLYHQYEKIQCLIVVD